MRILITKSLVFNNRRIFSEALTYLKLSILFRCFTPNYEYLFPWLTISMHFVLHSIYLSASDVNHFYTNKTKFVHQLFV